MFASRDQKADGYSLTVWPTESVRFRYVCVAYSYIRGLLLTQGISAKEP